MKTVGIIGLGSIGMRHAKNLLSLGHKVYGFDPNRKNISFGAIKTADTIESILDCDAIIIASPTSLHDEHISKVSPTDKPYFVEKPIKHLLVDTNGKDATMVGYNLRFHPCVLHAKTWIDNGLLGEPVWANFVCAQLNTKYTDSVILNWSHEIDVALHLLGRGSVASAVTCNSNGTDNLADIVLTHDNGCQSTIHLDYLTVPWIRQYVIVGTKASIVIDAHHRACWLRNSATMLDTGDYSHTSFDDDYKNEIESFIARCDGKETVGCTGAEGIEVLKVCLDAKRS